MTELWRKWTKRHRNSEKGLITFSPLAQGQLTDRYLNGIPEDSRIRTDGRFLKESNLTPERLLQIRELNDMAAGRGEKLSEMALGWLLAQQEVTSVLIGASRPQQILDNIKAIHCAPFTEEELVRIDEIAAENTASMSQYGGCQYSMIRYPGYIQEPDSYEQY